MNRLCSVFKSCGRDIKKWLTKQKEVKEETLTDWLLYNLSEKVPTIKYKQFTRTEEGRKTGADWEWWFVFSTDKSFVVRVQAKKLKPNSDCYPGIAYTRNDKLQIERLLEDSASDGYASFYAFYSTETANGTMCKGTPRAEGIFIAEANKLRDEFILKSRKTLSPADVLKFANPLACLFCCPLTCAPHQNIEHAFKQYLTEYFPTYSNNSLAVRGNSDNLGFVDTPKNILDAINNLDIPDWWDTELRSSFQKTNAILIVDLRNPESLI